MNKLLLFLTCLLTSIGTYAQDTLQIFAPTITTCEDTIQVPIRVNYFDTLVGMQFTLNWDTSVIKFVSVTPFNPTLGAVATINQGAASNGSLTALWFNSLIQNQTLPDSSNLFIVRFAVTGAPYSSTFLSFRPNPTVPETYRQVGATQTIFPIDTVPGSITVIPDIGITCPANVTTQSLTGQAVAINGIAPLLNPVCEALSSVVYYGVGASNINGQTNAAGSFFNVGQTDVVYIAEGVTGEQYSCTFSVNVTLAAPTLTIGSVSAGCNDTLYVPLTATDLIELDSLSFSVGIDTTALDFYGITDLHPSLATATLDTSMLASGNIGFHWQRTDLVPPTLPQGDTLFLLKLLINDTAPLSTSVYFINMPNPVYLGLGQPPASAALALQDGTITNVDNTNPVLVCPADTSVMVMNSFFATIDGLTPLATDNCAVDFVTYTLSGATVGSGEQDASNTLFNTGITNVTYTATDMSGNQSVCTFNVTVSSEAAIGIAMDTVVNNCVQDTLTLPVRVKNFVAVDSLAFSVTWNTAAYTFVAITTPTTAPTTINANPAPTGIVVNIGTTAAEGITLSDDSILFNVRVVPSQLTMDTTAFGIVPHFALLANGNPAQLTGTAGAVWVNDTEAPVLTCPPSQMRDSDGEATLVVTGIAPTVTENCAVDTVFYRLSGVTTGEGANDASGTVFNSGTTKVTYYAMDIAGNIDSCSMDIQVANTMLISLDAVLTSCNEIVSVPMRVSDFMNINALGFTVSWDTAALAYQSIGNFNLQYLDTPDFGIANVSNGRLTLLWDDPTLDGVSVADSTAIFTLNFLVKGNYGSTTTLAFGNSPTTIEATMGESPTVSVPIVTQAGSVSVQDTQNPVILCPPFVRQAIESGTNTATVSNIAPVALSDNCGIAQVNYSITGATQGSGIDDASGTTFNFGDNVVQYTLTDLAGNSATCQVNVRIKDTLLTIITTPYDVACDDNTPLRFDVTTENFDTLLSLQYTHAWDETVLRFDSVSSLHFAPIVNFGYDSTTVGMLSFSWLDSLQNAVTYPDGTVLYSLYFTRIAGAGATSPLTYSDIPTSPEATVMGMMGPDSIAFNLIGGQLTVIDTVPPVLICPDSLTILSDPILGGGLLYDLLPTQVGLQPNPMDNCGIAGLTFAVTGATTLSGNGYANELLLNVGQHIVTYTAIDAGGNQSVCQIPILVIAPDDTTQMANVTSFLLAANDVTCTDTAASITVTTTNFNQLVGFQYTLRWDSTVLELDTVLVAANLMGLDITDFGFFPTIPQKGALTVSWFDIDQSGESVADFADLFTLQFNVLGSAGATSTFNFDGSITSIEASSGTPPTTIPISFISDTLSILDTVPPVFANCPTDINITLADGLCAALVEWVAPTITDNCATSPTLTSNYTSPQVFSTGVYRVTYTATDDLGNADSCFFTITIRDTVPPVITACPADIMMNVAPDSCGATLTWALPTATDDCNLTSFVSDSYNPGDFVPVGTHTITYTALDASANSTTCNFTITIVDNTIPVISNCPSNITLGNGAGQCGANASWTLPTFVDNCSPELLIVNATHLPGDFFPIGTTTVTYTVSDPAGNSAQCSFTVTVNDTETPVITNCPTNIMVMLPVGKCDTVLTWTQPTFSDNCTYTVVQSDMPGDTFSVGTTQVLIVVRDAAGNVSNCVFSIVVRDTVPPVFSNCPTDFTVYAPADNCGAAATWEAAAIMATDACGTVLDVSSSHQSGVFLPIGTTVVTYNAVDNSLNVGTCSFTITVADTLAPTFNSCPANIILPVAEGTCDRIVSWQPPFATDNCIGDLMETATHQPGATFPIGTTVVTYTATDVSGNMGTCSFTVTIEETTPPMPINPCPTNITVIAEGAACGANVNWTIPFFTDNCDDNLQYDANHQPNDFYPIGETVVYFTATDNAGNVGTCQFSIIVQDTVPPTLLTACPANITQTVFETNCGAVVTWVAPIFTDNCNVLVNSTHQPNDFFPIGTTTVTYTATDDSGNTITCSFDVIITDGINATADAETVCAGATTTLRATFVQDATYAWTGPDGFTANTFTANVTVNTAAQAGTYVVSITKFDGCVTVDSVTLSLLPAPVVNAVSNSIFCTNNTADLMFTENGGAAVSWQWISPEGTTFATTQAATLTAVNIAGGGLYRVIITDANGCTATDSVLIMMEMNPFMPVAFANDTTLCLGNSLVLAGSAFANMELSYNWIAAPTIGSGIATTLNNPIVTITPTEAGTYTYQYFITTASGCSSDTASVTVVVNPVPVVAISTNAPLTCINTNSTLTLNEIGGEADAWFWTGFQFSSTSQNNTIPNVTMANQGIYTVTGTITATGCTASAQTEVVITEQPIAPQLFAADTVVCLGSSTTLSGTTYSGNVVEFIWSATPYEGSGLTGAEASAAIAVTPTAVGTYTYSYGATVNGCLTTFDSVVIVVDELPMVIATATNQGQLTCVTANDTLYLSENGQEATGWLWLGPNSFGSNTANAFVYPVTPANAGTYYVTGFSPNGCAATDSVTVSISNALAAPTVTVAEDTLCVGQTLSFSTETVANATYLWQGPGQISSSGEDPNFTNIDAAYNGAYTLTVSVDGCTSPTSAPINIVVYGAPEAVADNVALTVGTTDATLNVLANDNLTANRAVTVTVLNETINGTLVNNGNGDFTYTPANQFVQTDQFRYKVCYVDCPDLCAEATVGLTLTNDGENCIIPNIITPNEDALNDELYIPCIENIAKYADNKLTIYNQWGDVVYEATPYLNDWKGTYNGNPLPDGTYFYVFQQTKTSPQLKGYITILK